MLNELDVGTEPNRRLLNDTIELLRSTGCRSLSNLDCEVGGDVVVISGEVRSYYLKQVAQTFILQAPKVKEVRNLVEVGKKIRNSLSGAFFTIEEGTS